MTQTPSPEYRLVLSPKAQADVENILRYTGEKWGEKQILIYNNKLAEALETLRAHPARGYETTELPQTHRLYPVGSHVIVYRVKGHVVGVIRILHKRMSPPLHI